MKNVILFGSLVLVAILTSCSKPAAKEVELAGRCDSVSYAYGTMIGSQLNMYQFAADSLAKANPSKVTASILKGFEKAYKNDKEPNEFLGIGLQLGRSFEQLRKDGIMGGAVEYNEEALLYGLVNQLSEQNDIIAREQADEYLNLKMREIRERQAKEKAQIQIQPIDISEE